MIHDRGKWVDLGQKEARGIFFEINNGPGGKRPGG